MAEILYKCKENNLTVKFLKKPQKYYIYHGKFQININNEPQKGFDTIHEAISISKILFHDILIENSVNYYFDYLDFYK